jgi:O-succinylbenzoic acid--CoA ligase
VAILSRNSIEYILTILSLIHIGATVVPLNIYNPSRQILSQLKDIGCLKMIFSEEFHDDRYKKNLQVLKMEKVLSGRLMVKELPNLAPLLMEHIATILFTSGSSTKPKAVVHTIGNHYFSALGSNLNIPLGPGDRWLLSLPIYHVGGLAIIFRTILIGATIVIPDDNNYLEDSIRKHQITHLSLVPTQLMRLIAENQNVATLHNLKAILIGGASIPKSLTDKTIEYKLPVYTSYGSTEMSSQITTTRPGDGTKKLQTSGKVLKYRQLMVSNDGELLVKGYTLFKGYLIKNKIRRNVNKQGWFRRGDLGYIDKEGYLTVLARKDNMFISGGENIYPEEIERHLLQMEGMVDALVVDVPDKEFGAQPVAFIRMKRNMVYDTNSIYTVLKQKLAKFKMPKYIFVWPEGLNTLKANRGILRKVAMEKLAENMSD